MKNVRKESQNLLGVALVALTLGTTPLLAQSGKNPKATSQDSQFLQDFSMDSNFEIATSRLALAKSSSKDVKDYANMVLHDHLTLKSEMRGADRAAGIAAANSTNMTDDERSRLDKLKPLSGVEFDKAYIQDLIKGNSNIDQEEKTEASDSTVLSIRALAAKAAATDQKHARKAKELAGAHGVQS